MPAAALAQDAPQRSFNVRLSPEDLNVISEGLGEMPLKRSMGVWGRLNSQIDLQIKATKNAKPPEPEKSSEADKPTEPTK